MDKYRKEKNKKHYSIRGRKNIKKAACRSKYREVQQVIQKAEKTSLTSTDILKLLKNEPNFLGIFASDQISSVSILGLVQFSDFNEIKWLFS